MKNAYQITGVRQTYGDIIALNIDDYCVSANIITALVGPNGSGKSTLMDLFAFVSKPVEGEIRYYDREIKSGGDEILRRNVGYVQQKPYLMNTTVAKNIELGLKLRKVDKLERSRRASKIMDEFDISYLEHRRACELSGGEIQKVAIARAIILEPEVLILDEPFSHLDSKFNSELEKWLRQKGKDGEQTIIFSTHDQWQAQRLADRICSLIDGFLVPASIINLYYGKIDTSKALFITDKLSIHIPEQIKSGSKLLIESTHIVLSRHGLQSSMRNMFKGAVKSIKEEDGQIHLNVEAGELFRIIITAQAFSELAVNIGELVWVGFKSTAIRVF